MKEWLKNNIVSSLTFATILGVVFYSAELKQLLFSSPQIKYKTEEYMEVADKLKLFKKNQNDSISKARDSIAEAKHRAFQDSIDRVRDTLTKRNAVTTYQNKQRLDSVASMLFEMKQSLDHALEHIDQ